MRVNIWLALRQAAHDAVRNELTLRRTSEVDRESTIPEWIAKFFMRGVHDLRMSRDIWRMDRTWFDQGAVYRRWHLWSLSYQVDKPQRLAEVVNRLLEQYPNMVKLVGAWDYEGNQLAPVDPRVLEFQPDLVAEDGSVWRPETPRDVNLMFGQAPRDFS